MSDLRLADLPRLALQLAVALGILLGVEALAHLPLGAPAEGAAIRLAVRTAAGKIEICREVPAAELAQLPIHMRRPRICEEQPVAYRLTLRVDGVTGARRSAPSGAECAATARWSSTTSSRFAPGGRSSSSASSPRCRRERRRRSLARFRRGELRQTIDLPAGTHRARDLGSERRADDPAVGSRRRARGPSERLFTGGPNGRTIRAIVFPLPAHLSELAALSTVQLADTPFPLLLVAHQAAESTGLLVARRGPIEKRVVLDHGVPVDCRSNLAHETFSRFLAASGRLTATEANAVLRAIGRAWRAARRDPRQEGRMDATELHRLLQQSLARKLFDLFTWRDGEVTFESGDVHAAAALKVKVARLVLTGIERFVPQETIDGAIGPLAGSLFARPPRRRGARRGAAAQSASERTARRARTPRRLEELLPIAAVAAGGAESRDLGAGPARARDPGRPSLLSLSRSVQRPSASDGARSLGPRRQGHSDAGAADPAAPTPQSHEIRRSPPRAQPGPASGPGAGGGRADSPTGGDGLREDSAIRTRTTFWPRANRPAGRRDARALLRSSPAEFAPWRFERPELQSAAPAAEELFAAGALAFARLNDAKERAALLRARSRCAGLALRRQSSRARRSLPPRAPARPGRRIAAPGRLRPRSASRPICSTRSCSTRRAGRSRKRSGGRRRCSSSTFAADCDPQNGAYRAEAAHCRFLLAPSSMGARRSTSSSEAQRIDPEAITPYLYAGEIAAQLGRFDEAETHLRSAARRLGPTDRRALDALRDLAKKRKK